MTTTIEKLAEALRLISVNGCTNYRPPISCINDPDRSRGARYSADSWCGGCIAAEALASYDAMRAAESQPTVQAVGDSVADPYRVTVDKIGCPHCCGGRVWTVIGPDEVCEGESWTDEGHAQEVAERMCRAHAAGKASAKYLVQEGLAAALRSAHVAEGKLTDANSIGFRIGFAAAIAHIEGVAMGTATPATDTPPPADDARDAELDAAWKATGVAGTVRGMATLADVIATNRENAALDAEDARRYRWLRNESWCGSNSSQKGTAVVSVVGYTYPGKILAEEAMDAAVDAAMAKDGAK